MSSWYYNKDLKPQGPLTLEDMKKKISRGEISPFDLILKDGEQDWKMAQEWREFPGNLFPAFQGMMGRAAPTSEKEWTLLRFSSENPQGAHEGPYSILDFQEMLQKGSVSYEDYVWRSGLTGWVQIKDRAEFLSNSTTTSRDL